MVWDGKVIMNERDFFVLMRFSCNYKHIERDKEAVGNN